MRRLLFAAVVCAPLVGCVDTPESDHLRLERSQGALEAQGTAATSMLIEADGEEVGRVEGEVDFDADVARMVVHSDVTAELRVIEGTIYQQALPTAPLPEGIRWIRLNPEAMAVAMQVDPDVAAGLTADGNVDPADVVGNVAVERVGHEEVDGVDTTHLRAVLTGDALDQRLDQIAAATAGLPDGAGDVIDEITVDVWIDEDGVRRRDARTLTQGEHTLTFTNAYEDFGIEVDVEVPDEDETIDFLDAT